MIVTADKVTYREHGGAEAVIDYSDPKRRPETAKLPGYDESPGRAFKRTIP